MSFMLGELFLDYDLNKGNTAPLYYAEMTYFHTNNCPSKRKCILFTEMKFEMTRLIFAFSVEAVFREPSCECGHCGRMATLNVSVCGFIAADAAL